MAQYPIGWTIVTPDGRSTLWTFGCLWLWGIETPDGRSTRIPYWESKDSAREALKDLQRQGREGRVVPIRFAVDH